ncbi:inactive pancreatic lipase-related protein 1-like [Ornithodoros turicata]|uniref:inactive pancreatic lipase-related protein 1-like n=1 Tax=Ornithodoros turicata TaxID=34597 RepID=UPI00313911D1
MFGHRCILRDITVSPSPDIFLNIVHYTGFPRPLYLYRCNLKPMPVLTLLGPLAASSIHREMLASFIVLLVGTACQVSCRSLNQPAHGRTWDVGDLLLDGRRNGITNDSESEVREGMLLAESMYLAVKMSEIRKKTPLPAVYSNPTACFEDLGCFSTDGMMNHVGELPQHPDEIGTSFALYTNLSSEHPIHFNYNELNQTAEHFATAKDIVLVIHGFMGSGEDDWVMDITKKLLEKEDRVVITVDWSEGALFPDYTTAVANSALVGRQVSLLLQRLKALYPEAVHPQKVHLIGFSLGAHVSGFCGRHYFNETHQRIGRITALDAAGPLFVDSQIHVSRKDASYVDAIHTSGGASILLGQFGTNIPFAHADFYPNGGQSQPGCSFLDVGCSHRRSVEYFIESLLAHSTHCRFRSHSCSVDAITSGDCEAKKWSGEMGYPSYFVDTRGQQFLKTKSEPPFCIV